MAVKTFLNVTLQVNLKKKNKREKLIMGKRKCK